MMRVELNGRDEIVSLGLAPDAKRASPTLSGTALATAEQLDEYLRGERKAFDLPLAPPGTPFQHHVWLALRAVPFGVTTTYAAIARAIGRPKASRAVGAACGANPIGIVVPCHRIIGSGGSLTGYYWGTQMKARLLALEGAENGSLFTR